MTLILSSWAFTVPYVEVFPGVHLGFMFDVLAFVTGDWAVYQDVIKGEDFNAISLCVLIFDPEASS